MLLRIEDKTL